MEGAAPGARPSRHFYCPCGFPASDTLRSGVASRSGSSSRRAGLCCIIRQRSRHAFRRRLTAAGGCFPPRSRTSGSARNAKPCSATAASRATAKKHAAPSGRLSTFPCLNRRNAAQCCVPTLGGQHLDRRRPIRATAMKVHACVHQSSQKAAPTNQKRPLAARWRCRQQYRQIFIRGPRTDKLRDSFSELVQRTSEPVLASAGSGAPLSKSAARYRVQQHCAQARMHSQRRRVLPSLCTRSIFQQPGMVNTA